MLTQARALELFEYNPTTGVVTRRTRRGPGIAGSVVGGRYKDHGTHYLRAYVDGKSYRLHRIIFLMIYGRWPNQVDHIDHNGENNCVLNIREVDSIGNRRNQSRPKNNVSGVTGVLWYPTRNKWKAVISIGGRQKYVGTFKNFDDAVAARKQAEIKYGFHKNHGAPKQ